MTKDDYKKGKNVLQIHSSSLGPAWDSDSTFIFK